VEYSKEYSLPFIYFLILHLQTDVEPSYSWDSPPWMASGGGGEHTHKVLGQIGLNEGSVDTPPTRPRFG